MKIKVFTHNQSGKIEFTRTELEKLLDEVYSDGYKDGKNSCNWTWNSPYLNNAICSSNNAIGAKIDNAIVNQAAAVNVDNSVESPKITNTISANKPNVCTVTMKCGEDFSKAAEALCDLLNTPGALSTKGIDDVYSKLAKELNF